MITIEDRIRYINAKIRNIIYYRLTVVPACCESGDPQLNVFRMQFIHVLRQLRKSLLSLVNDLPETMTEEKSYYLGIVNLISPKVKSVECRDVIKRINDYVKGYRRKEGEKKTAS
jgi:hypothetical protein